jgi:hypothetical protein
MSFQIKLLRGISLFVFLISVIAHGISAVVDVASTHIKVRDLKGIVIGEAWIPFDYSTFQLVTFIFMILSGLQYWTIIVATRHSSEKGNTAEQHAAANP